MKQPRRLLPVLVTCGVLLLSGAAGGNEATQGLYCAINEPPAVTNRCTDDCPRPVPEEDACTASSQAGGGVDLLEGTLSLSGQDLSQPGLGRRERKEVFEQINGLAVDIAAALADHGGRAFETAFRCAAETWMQQNNVIRVTRNGEVLPSFYRFQSH